MRAEQIANIETGVGEDVHLADTLAHNHQHCQQQ
jgi:hypothetical protein